MRGTFAKSHADSFSNDCLSNLARRRTRSDVDEILVSA